MVILEPLSFNGKAKSEGVIWFHRIFVDPEFVFDAELFMLDASPQLRDQGIRNDGLLASIAVHLRVRYLARAAVRLRHLVQNSGRAFLSVRLMMRRFWLLHAVVVSVLLDTKKLEWERRLCRRGRFLPHYDLSFSRELTLLLD